VWQIIKRKETTNLLVAFGAQNALEGAGHKIVHN
jgi:hypothetical protein